MATVVFTGLVKEVKLIALQLGIRLHQYLDDCLIFTPSKDKYNKQMEKLLKLVKDLGFVVNFQMSELYPSQRIEFLGYNFLLDFTHVRSTQDRWIKL